MGTKRHSKAATPPEGSGTGSQFKRGRKPHNAPSAPDYKNLAELIQLVGSEPRKVLVGGKTVEMTRSERMMRLQLERAMQGKAQDVRQVLSLMLRYPGISSSSRKIIRIIMSSTDSSL
jgi:hypothetical protein